MTGRWRERWARTRGLFRRRPDDRELDDEFESHLTLAADELVRRGVDPEAARRRAAIAFGSRLAARQTADAQRGLPGLEALLADLRTAVRGLRRAPGFTVAAVLTLGLGIGVNVAVFTVTQATLFKGYRGVPDNDRLVFVTTGPDCCISLPDLQDWTAATTLEGLGAVADLRVAVEVEGRETDTVTATEVTPNAFHLLRVMPQLGRDFVAADAVPGAPPVAILSHDYWQARFGGDPGALGRSLRVNGVITTVVGVMPPAFAFPQQQELWVPLVPTPARRPRDARGLWFAVGRLGEGATIDQARTELQAIGRQMAQAYPQTNARVLPVVKRFRELFIGDHAVAVYGALWVAVGLVLVVACANLANLMLARATRRTREIAVQLALGAGRVRIARQMLAESLLLSITGGAVGWWIAGRALRLYEAYAVPPTQPWARQLLDYAVDLRVLGYLVAVTLVTGVLFGLLPALRLSSLDVQTALRDGGRGTVGRAGRRRVMNAIVVTQVALAVVLLGAAGVLVRSFLRVSGRDVGYDPTHTVVALTTLLPSATYPDDAARWAYFDRLVASLKQLPGVEAVGLSDGLVGQGARRRPIEVEGQPPGDDGAGPTARTTAVGGDYFASLGVSARAGRLLDAGDDTSGEAVAVLNRRVAEALWPQGDPIGRRIRIGEAGEQGPWRTVVGVVPDLHQGDLARPEVDPTVYVPLRDRPARGAWLLVRASGAPESLLAPFRHALQAADPSLPIWLGPFTLRQWMAGNNWRRGVYGGLFLMFAALALSLACLGLFAVVAHAVAHRTQEIGLRVAIGASRRDVLRLVLRQAFEPAGIGLACGLAGSVAANRVLASQLVQISPTDPLTLGLVTAILVTVAGLGCLVPARRALRVDPLVALRLD